MGVCSSVPADNEDVGVTNKPKKKVDEKHVERLLEKIPLLGEICVVLLRQKFAFSNGSLPALFAIFHQRSRKIVLFLAYVRLMSV